MAVSVRRDPLLERELHAAACMQGMTASPLIIDASLCWLAAETGITAVMSRAVRDLSRHRLPHGGSFEIL